MRCAHCKRRDVDINHVKDCSGVFPDIKADKVGPVWPASDAAIGYALGLQAERVLPDNYVIKSEADYRAMERSAVSGDINLLKTFARKDKAPTRNWDIPDGRYALVDMSAMGNDAQRGWTFWEVSNGKGKWKGRTFIVMLIGAPGSYRKIKVDPVKRNSIMDLIAADPKKAAVDYGLQSRECGRCHSPLTDPESLKRGLGPICAGKSGWF